jgi:YHS domain-containing protein
MKSRKTQFGIVFTLISLLMIGLVALTGCKKESEPAPPAETEETVSATIEQTVCPVMAGPVNKDIFTEYKGKKVYFCCAGCKTKFEEAPEKYLGKLPQFKE